MIHSRRKCKIIVPFSRCCRNTHGCVCGLKPHLEEEKGSCEVTQQSSVLFNCCFIELFHQLSVWPAPLPHHYLPTENLLQLTWDAKPTLGSPPRGIGRTKQKLAVSRDGECRLLMFNVSNPFVVFITGSKWKALRTTQRPISRRAFQAHCS